MNNMKKIFSLMLSVMLSACAVMTVNEHELQPGSADGVTFSTTGRPTYDKVWEAATKAMSNGMKIVYSHKPSGTIKSRVGSDHTGKVVAIFITPTTPRATEYKIELVSKKPMGFGQPEKRNWEPSVVKDFEEALNKK